MTRTRAWSVKVCVLVPLLLASACGSDAAERSGETVATSVDDSGIADPVATSMADSGDADLGFEEPFVDPQGTYTMTIATDWNEMPGTFVKEIEMWAIAEPVDGFAANVNVLTQDARGTDLSTYLDFTVRSLGALELMEQTIVTGVNGNELGLLEYNGIAPGAPPDRPLHFLQTIEVRNDNAIVATLTAREEDFDTYRSTVEPFLLSLQAT